MLARTIHSDTPSMVPSSLTLCFLHGSNLSDSKAARSSITGSTSLSPSRFFKEGTLQLLMSRLEAAGSRSLRMMNTLVYRKYERGLGWTAGTKEGGFPEISEKEAKSIGRRRERGLFPREGGD